MQDKDSDRIMDMTGHKHLPAWFKMAMYAVIAPPVTLVLSFFFLSKFTGMEDQFGMIMESVAYNISGGPVNKESTEMGKMIGMMSSQLEVINDLRQENAMFRDEMLAGVNRIAGQVDGLGERLSALETWAIRHSDDGATKFGR